MKKVYEVPSVEKLAFRYRDQVVAASGGSEPTAAEQSWWESLPEEVKAFFGSIYAWLQSIRG